MKEKTEQQKAGGTPAPPSAEEILRRARELVEKGWGRGDCTSAWPDLKAGCFCADTAIHEVAGLDGPIPNPAQVALRRAVGIPDEDWEHDSRAFYAWHDAPERTQAEVLAAFDKAIALASVCPTSTEAGPLDPSRKPSEQQP